MSKKGKEFKGNAPLRHVPQQIIPITKDQMWTIANRGLIWSVDEGSFIFFDHENLSGSQVYWANLRALAVAENGYDLVMIYQNGAEETLLSSYDGFNKLVKAIPDHFGWFGHMLQEQLNDAPAIDIPAEPLDYDEAENPLDNLAQAKQLLHEIQGKQKAWLESDSSNEEQKNDTVAATVSSIIAEEPILSTTADTPLQPATKSSDDDLLKQILANAETSLGNTVVTANDNGLLSKIMQESSGSQYRTSFGNNDAARDLERSIHCPNNAQILASSSLGFTWQDIGGQVHQIDFGHYSDAYLDKATALILEHRYGNTLTLPSHMTGWDKVLESLPFRFRSIERSEVLALVNRRKNRA